MIEMKLEVVVVPVSDIERAKKFYEEQLGFVLEVDMPIGEHYRTVQLTPLGSGCSINLDNGYTKMEPGTVKGLQLVVANVDNVRQVLLNNGVNVSSVQHYEGTQFVEGRGGRWNSFIFFSDPDGNEWVVQERPAEE